MSSVNLYNISEEAVKWRDLSPELQQEENRIRICLVAGGILLLIGTALAVYFAATAPSVSRWCDACKVFHIISQGADAAPIVGVVGGGGSIAMIIIGLIKHPISYEYKQNRDEEDLSKQAIREELILTLTTGEIQDIHKKYYKKNGGLGPLVRQGYMLTTQGEKLRPLLETYHNQQEIISSLESQPLCKRAIDKDEAPKSYMDAKAEIDRLGKEWQTVRQEIADQYQSQNAQ